MQITLYEFTPTRSSRVRWALLEAGLDFDSRNERELIGSDELRKIHPQAKLPAMTVDGKPLFESAAMCTYIADRVPEKKLIAPSGTWERALHDQWVCYGLTEMEAFLWHNARNSFVLPEEQRITTTMEQNNVAFNDAAGKLDAVLADVDYLVGGQFSMTDVIMGFIMHFAATMGQLAAHPNLTQYHARLCAREHCPYEVSD